MRRNPLYAFRSRATVGIYEVPLNSTIHILDAGDGLPIFVEIVGKAGLTSGSTIGQFLDYRDPIDGSKLYIDLSNGEVSLSELEKMVEDGDAGWRLLGSEPDNHGDIGRHAIDLSESTSISTTQGATGANSIAGGKNTTASGEGSVALGLGTSAIGAGTTTLGRYNDTVVGGGYQSDKMLVVGIGDNNTIRKDGLIVYADGIIRAPGLEKLEIVNSGVDTLVTKEYSDDVDGGDI